MVDWLSEVAQGRAYCTCFKNLLQPIVRGMPNYLIPQDSCRKAII